MEERRKIREETLLRIRMRNQYPELSQSEIKEIETSPHQNYQT
jgi:hypothetical protein